MGGVGEDAGLERMCRGGGGLGGAGIWLTPEFGKVKGGGRGSRERGGREWVGEGSVVGWKGWLAGVGRVVGGDGWALGCVWCVGAIPQPILQD